jgi:hypothetical protein
MAYSRLKNTLSKQSYSSLKKISLNRTGVRSSISFDLELKGKLVVLLDKIKNSKGLTKQELVIDIDLDTKYPQKIICQIVNREFKVLENIKIGDSLIVRCNITGVESKGKYYNTLKVREILKQE